MNVKARIQNTILLLFLCLLAPLASDAANQAACCNVRLPPPSPPGDEGYFSIPGGVPNVMILLDNSGSMLDLPIAPDFPSTAPTSGGTCTGSAYNTFTSLRKTLPYDSGQTSASMTDAPPWSPAGGCSGDNCLFDPTAYYVWNHVDGVSSEWVNSSALRHPSGTGNGTGSSYPSNRTGACYGAKTASECATCLDTTAGFYFYKANGGTGNWTAVFKGDFLNGYPPKYVAARKVVKDLAFMDPANPSPVDTVRLGLTVFNMPGNYSGQTSALQTADGGSLVVPLGPDCGHAYPYTLTAFQTARQTLINAINSTGTPLFDVKTCTPAAESLFNVGQYFTNTASGGPYQTLFGSNWINTSFNENAAGTVNASWASGGNNRSICWSCEQSSVVIVTDGQPKCDGNLPASPTPSSNHPNLLVSAGVNDFRKWTTSTISCGGGGGGGNCDNCGCDLAVSSQPNLLHKVAYFLNQTDLRSDMSTPVAVQKVTTYTISFGLRASTDPAAVTILQKTADLGGGLFKNTSSGDELESALSSAVNDVVSKATSFSASSASSLQTSKTAQTGSYLARFRPLDGPAWEGHLFSAMVFDEFGMGCVANKTDASQTLVPTSLSSVCAGKNPNLNGNKDANNNSDCTDVFLVDQDCDPIIEDDAGTFHKGSFDATSRQVVSGPSPANLAWDAGEILSTPTETGYKSADASATNARKIWTVIDTNGDGKFTSTDGLTEFKSDNAAALAPFLSLDPTWCLNMMQLIGMCGLSPLPACPTVAGWTAANTTTCATQVINYIRGYDVTDQDGDHCGGPGNPSNAIDWGSCTTSADCKGSGETPAKNTCVSGKCHLSCTNGEERNRVNDARTSNPQFWKLGDIFHSAPAVVSPPFTKPLASTGWENQSMMSLFASWGSSAPGTPLNPSASPDAYETYVSTNASRPPVILVGANDGMLHAFCAAATASGGCVPGTELWAFIPPDILPRLRDSLFQHQYYVDGNIMVRDVWVDANGNGKKESTEYHTMAVITERSGGHSFTGLDITDTTLDHPVFRWTFPQLCTPESRIMGETWSDFPPRPPPIGPVKIALPYSGGPADPLSRNWEERWVVGLNGGFDSTLVRGRAMFINDVWTGDVLWSLTDADLRTGGKNDLGYGNAVSLFPVPATIGLIDAGSGNSAYGDSDGLFDTATFGDMGGNLWLVRMSDPGILDATTKRVTNWFAARAFEEQRQTTNVQNITQRSPFFFMTGNAFDTELGYLRTYAGTGNRERLLDSQQTCSADNILGCCQAGCTINNSTTPMSSSVDNLGSCSVAQSFSCNAGVLTSTPATGTGTCGSTYSCTQNNVTVTLNMTCNSVVMPPVVATLTCDSSGLCSQVQGFGTSSIFTPVSTSSSATLPKSHMYGVWSYGGSTSSRTFNTLAGAKIYDAHRSTDVTYSAAACAPANGCKLVNTESASYNRTTGVTCGTSPCQATTFDPGWMYEYGVYCPLQSCSPAPPWTDEKTATGASPAWGCTLFSSTRPTGGVGDPCTSAAGAPIAYGYALDYLTGAPSSVCGYFSGNNGSAAYSRNSSAPPQNPMPRIIITADGQVKMTTLQMDAGSQPDSTDFGYSDSLVNLLYYLEVPRDLHGCRHVDTKTCK